jgi:hypothetical protein
MNIQEEIVAQLEEEQTLVESSGKLIEKFTNKIKTRINEIWGE